MQFNGYQQQDSQELLGAVLDGLHVRELAGQLGMVPGPGVVDCSCCVWVCRRI